MKLPPKCLNLDIVINSYNHLKDIKFSNIDIDSDISILIGADNPIFIYIRTYAQEAKMNLWRSKQSLVGLFLGDVRIIINTQT